MPPGSGSMSPAIMGIRTCGVYCRFTIRQADMYFLDLPAFFSLLKFHLGQFWQTYTVPKISPHKNRACHGWSRCTGKCLVSVPDVFKSRANAVAVASAPAVTCSVFMRRYILFVGTVLEMMFRLFYSTSLCCDNKCLQWKLKNATH